MAASIATGAAMASTPHRLTAQLFARPWLQWHTIHAGHFDVQYPTQLESWAQFVAERMPAVDSAVSALVGYSPPMRVQIVVEDPYDVSNGFAFTLIDHPVIVFWASPPDPRESIGQFRTWGEMLAVHEFGHVAHLTRPSRNPFTRLIWRLAPVDLGPIAIRSPRWAIEGYATYIEGRVTGTGRPHGVWRPATLRQWALEGRLPTYSQMSDWGDYSGGDFAYLAGSAFLEWLARHHGDSSLVDVWRRLSARTNRSFDEAFAGVYGDPPQVLYDQFRAEVTADAVNADSAMARGLVEGDLVQHLARGTGDPALSNDGKHLALVLRSANRPSRVVVWSTAPESDSLDRRAREQLLKADPEDVPARRGYPPAKRALATLVASDGRSYEDPRWFPDGRHLLLWRPTRRGDGTLRPELYSWDYTTGKVRRLTGDADARNADPSPDGRHAVALQCPAGHCDVVVVDLQSRAIQTIAAGDVLTSYSHPRWSPDGRTIAVSLQRENRWRIALLDDRGGVPRFVDPDDGANRFDPAWLTASSLVAVSDRAGAPDLERIDFGSPSPSSASLTRVIGAAVAPAPNEADGSIWFLSLHSRGLDVRRLASAAPVGQLASNPLLDPHLAPIVVARSSGVRAFAPSPTIRRAYGTGDRTTRWLPAASFSTTGQEGVLALINSDAVGRLTLLGQLAAGHGDVWRGGTLDGVWQGWRPAVRASLFDVATSYPLPGGAVGPFAHTDRLLGGRARLDFSHSADPADVRVAVGGAGSRLEHDLITVDGGAKRYLAFAELGGDVHGSGDPGSVSGALTAHVTTGYTAGIGFQRFLGTAAAHAFARDFGSLDASATFGALSANAPDFERFTLGGPAITLIDPALLSQRLPMGALPLGIATGERVLQYRVATSLLGIAPFFWGASAENDGHAFSTWHRVVGGELTIDQSALPVLGLPGARLISGVGYSLDPPFARQMRGYITIVLRSYQ